MSTPLCPRCGGGLQPILYGMPAEPPGPDVTLGGCTVSESDPTAACKVCGYELRAPAQSLAVELGLE